VSAENRLALLRRKAERLERTLRTSMEKAMEYRMLVDDTHRALIAVQEQIRALENETP
jgi:hypothetical protein